MLKTFSGLILATILLCVIATTAFAGGNLGEIGTFNKWHKVEIMLTGPNSSVTGNPNPFEIDVDVTFTGPGGTFSIPAFYDADGSGGTSGNVWKVRFSANAIGSWTFSSSSANATLNGYTGSFTIIDAPPGAPDFFKWGRLKYVGGHYLKFTDGPFWIKAGVDDPENFLGNAFGANNWAAKKAEIDKIAAKKANSVYLILNTVDGDGKDVWPWWGSTNSEAKSNGSRFNPAKLLAWEDFFLHCNNNGVVVHIVFDDDSAWAGYDRTLFYREMIARFGYLPGIIWNIGEEADELYSNAQQIEYAGLIKSMNSLGSPVTVHRTSTSSSNWPFLDNANFDFTSIQTNPGGATDFTTATLDNNNAIIINNRNGSVSAGRPIAVMIDEAPRVTTVNTTTRLKLRSQVLYPIFLGGGNFELHYQDQFTQGGSTTFDTLAPMLDDMRIAREFLETLPFDQMSPNNSLLSSTSGNFCFAKPGLAYGIYMTNGTTINLNLTGVKGAFQVKWHNVTTGATSNGPIILGGAQRSLGAPAYSGDVACSVVRTVTYPGASWSSATAADLGVDLSKLTAFSGSAGGNGIAIKDGYVVHQWGSPSSTLNWASASKPTNVTALFIAMAEGKTTLDKPIYPDYWPNASGKDRNITFRHMANMMSGYMRPENPGAAWSYNDYNVNLFTKTLYQKVFNSNPQTIMTNRLSALQFQDNPQWNTGTNYGRLTSCSGRDFARIGWMWANSGKWNASTIIPSTFFDQYCKVAVSSSVPVSSGSDSSDYLGVGTYGGGTNQTTDGPGEYGFFWWNNQNGWWADAPRDTFMADGHGGKECVVIMPSLGLVVSGNGNWGEGTSSTRNTLFNYLKESVVTPGADSEAPSIPYNVKATALSGNTAIQITWTKSADNLAVQGYKIFRNGVQIGTSPRDSFTDTAVVANNTYLYTVSAYDYSNNNSAQSTPARIALLLADSVPPSVPTGVTAVGQSSSSIKVTWNASTDNIGVTGYRIYRNGVLAGTSTGTTYIDTGLSASTTYTYTVSAYDASGNYSAQSAPATGTTLSPDTVPPSVPTNVQVTNVTHSTVQLTWTASTDNVAVTGYKIYRNGSEVGTSSGAAYNDSDLEPETSYTYRVAAYDAAGNLSAQSTPVVVSTLSPPASAQTYTWQAEFTTLSGSGPGGFTSPYTSPDGGTGGNFSVTHNLSLPASWLSVNGGILTFAAGSTSCRGRFSATPDFVGTTGASVGYRWSLTKDNLGRGPFQLCIVDGTTQYNCYVEYYSGKIRILNNSGTEYTNPEPYTYSLPLNTFRNWCLAVKVGDSNAHWILWIDGTKILFSGSNGKHTYGGIEYSFKTPADTFTGTAYIGLGELSQHKDWGFKYDWVRWQNAGPFYIGDPWVTTHPTSQTKWAGEDVTFTCAGTSSGTIGYQWQVYSGGAWSDISGATNTVYTFTTASSDNGKKYRCRLSNNTTTGTEDVVYTNEAKLTVNALPSAPTNAAADPATICVGGSSTLSATVSSGETVEWFTGSCGGTPISSPVSPITTTTYYARAKNTTTGFVSASCDSVTVTVVQPPTAPTSANANPDTISSGQSSTLSYIGGQGDALKWYKGGCGSGESIGSGNNLQVSPTETTTYYCRWESDVCDPSSCASVTVTVGSAAMAIGDVKKKADNESVSVSEKVVTAVFDDHFYIEEDDRSSGIRIIPSAMLSGLAVGDIVSVNGTIETSSDNERYIDAGSVTIIDSGTPLEPVGMTSKALGGGDTLEYNASTGAGQKGVEDGVGANTIGRLVKITGEVTISGAGYFYIQDGYEARDFSIFRGVRVMCPGIEKPEKGSMKSVVGISQIMKVNGRVFRTLRIRGSSDITTHSP